MKKLHLLLLLAMGLMAVSCSDSPDELSSGQVTDKVEDQLKLDCKDKAYATIKTGYYELNDLSSRQQLMKLQAAGVITYSVQRYAWYTRHSYTKSVYSHSVDYYWIYSGDYAFSKPVYTKKKYTDYDYEEHFLVKVELTEEGKKLQVDSLPQPQVEIDKDMKMPEIDESKFPETTCKLDETWPEIPNPGSHKMSASNSRHHSEEIDEEENDYDEIAPEGYEENDTTGTAPKKEKKYVPHSSDWEDAVDVETAKTYFNEVPKLTTTDVYLHAYDVKVKKARNIQIKNTDDGTFATAEVIYRYADVTPVGRIVYAVNEKVPFSGNVALTYYQDKGWELDTEKSGNATKEEE